MPSHRAFTLIESLTTIAVIGAIVGLTVPVWGKMRESARQAACTSNLDQIGEATQIYLAENQERFPAYFFTFSPGNSGKVHVAVNPKKAANAGWDIYHDKVVLCPKDPEPSTVPVLKDDNAVAWEPTSFGFNIEINLHEIPAGNIREPGSIVVFHDGVMGKSDTMKEDGSGKIQGNFDDSYDYVNRAFRARHLLGPGVGQVLFADWHVAPIEQVQPEQVILVPTSKPGNGGKK